MTEFSFLGEPSL